MSALANIPAQQYFARPSTLAFHNLCTMLTPPPGLISLLGLGHKYCLERSQPPTNLRESHDRFARSIRLRYWLCENDLDSTLPDNDDDDYNPNLYVKSYWNPPRVEQGNIEPAMMEFFNRMDKEAAKAARSPARTNLTPFQRRLLQEVQQDQRFIIALTDKNLGPCIIE